LLESMVVVNVMQTFIDIVKILIGFEFLLDITQDAKIYLFFLSKLYNTCNP